MSKITYPTKTTGDTFSGAEATEIKTVVNANDDALIALNTRTSNIDNTADADKPVSTAQGAAIATAKSEAIAASIPTSEKGAANGVATLGADGTLPIAQSSKLGTVVPVNTTVVAGMNPQQTAEALQGQLDTKQDKEIVVSSNTVASNNANYTLTANATFTDPTPVEGKGFVVFIRTGTAVVGGISYGITGTIVHRIYQGGVWGNYIFESGKLTRQVIIKTSDNPQTVFDANPAGTNFIFEEGTHEWGFNNAYNSILYIDKSCKVEIPYGAKLKLANGTTTLQLTPEITNNQGTYKLLDDLSMGATSSYNGALGRVDFYAKIIGTGTPNTFEWGTFVDGVYTTISASLNCTTTEQTTSNGVKIKFGATTGHSLNSIWFVSYSGQASYGIRTGMGFNPTEIKDVSVYGLGEIDMNSANNIQPSALVKDVSSCVLFHGRLRGMNALELKLYGCERTVMAYGDMDGTYLFDGTTVDSTASYDIEELNILGIRSLNSGANSRGFLIGHPSHRGSVRKLKILRCNLTGERTLIEPNFNTNGYVICDNILDGVAGDTVIHCWRFSENGAINNNVILNSPNYLQSLRISAPGGWSIGKNITFAGGNVFSTGSADTYAKITDAITALAPTTYVRFDSSNCYKATGALASDTELVTKALDVSGNKIGVNSASFGAQGTFSSSKNALKLTSSGAVYRFRRTFASPEYITLCVSAELSDVTGTTVLYSYRSSATQLIQISVTGGNAQLQFRGALNVMQTLTKPVVANVPFKVVVTYDKNNNSVKLYVDTVALPATSSYAISAEALDATDSCIGGFTQDGTTYTQSISGNVYVKAIALLNRVITSSEITAVMTNL